MAMQDFSHMTTKKIKLKIKINKWSTMKKVRECDGEGEREKDSVSKRNKRHAK